MTTAQHQEAPPRVHVGLPGCAGLFVAWLAGPSWPAPDSACGRFKMDPITLYREIPTPIARFGVRPDLSDAPTRDYHHMIWRPTGSWILIRPSVR